MPRATRWQRFHIDPLALLNDPDFQAMRELPDGSRRPHGDAAQLAYIKLLLGAWNEKEPGVIPYLVGRLARMAEMTVEEWLEVEPIIRPAVKIRERDSAWVLTLMVRDYSAQERTHKRLSDRGKQGNNKRWGNNLDRPAMHVGDRPSPSPSPSPSVFPPATPSESSQNLEPADAVSPAASVESSRGMVLTLANTFAMPRQKRPTPAPRDGHDPERLDRILVGQSKPVRNAMHKFAGWLWSTGTRDNEAIAELVAHRLTTNPENPYAYYATDGQARMTTEAKFRERRAAREKSQHDAADHEFLRRQQR